MHFIRSNLIVVVCVVLTLAPLIASAASCPNLIRNLSRGMRGQDVKELQQFLIDQNLLDTGLATGFFGAKTEGAVKKFQCTTMNICSGSANSNGYGVVGPRTRAAIAQLCNASSRTSSTSQSTLPTSTPSVDYPDFSVSPKNGTAPLTVIANFSGSSGCPTYSLDWGDGTKDASPPPIPGTSCTAVITPVVKTHTYTAAGTYVVTLNGQQPITVSVGQSSCTPLSPQTQTLSCPAGQTGSITQTRTSSCPGPVWSGWTTTTNTCMVSSPTETSIQPASVPTKVLSAIGGNSPLIDFLIQDVCVDDKNNPINGDPATCARHRDLKFGEFVPYQRTDRSWNLFYQASMSFPTEAPDGSLLVMKSMEFGGSTPGSAFRDYDAATPAIDGYDLHEANGAYISAISTQDPSGYKPLWAPGCAHDDSWVLWPSSLTSGVEGHSVFQLNSGLQCPSFFVPSLTNWHYYEVPITYTSGKTLNSIVSWHYNDGDTSKISAIEVFYNTKEYGGTRWDAWNTTGPAEPSGACNGVHEADFFGKHMYLIACRDWTFTTNLLVPINPLASPIGHELVFSKNQLVAGDFAQAQMGNWQRFNNGALMTDWQTSQEPVTNNYFLNVSCMSGCNGNSIYQDISASDWRGKITLRYGALLKAAQSANAVVTLFLLDANGAIIANPQIPVTVGTTWQHVDGTFEWDFSASPVRTIRYQIYINTAATQYSVDEAYLTPSY